MITNARGQSPCWLTPDELEQAQALIDLGFHFCGDRDDYCLQENKKLGSVNSWKFYGSYGNIVIDIVFKNALFSQDFSFDEGKYNSTLKQAKKAIKTAIEKQKAKIQQLSLF
jgi:hypothetical protein